MKKFIAVAILLIIACLCIVDLSHGQGSGDKFSAPQWIKDTSITEALLTAAVRAKLNDSTVWVADSALDLSYGVIMSAHFTSGFRDTLMYFFVDTADWARWIRSGAIDSRLKFSSSLQDSLFSTTDASKALIGWSKYATTATTAASALNADYATEAGYAARTGQDTVSYANGAYLAEYAKTALTVIDSVLIYNLDSATWALVVDSINAAVAGLTDSVRIAKTADSLTAGAFDSYGMFSTGMKYTHIPLQKQRSGLANLKVNLADPDSQTNPFMTYQGVQNMAMTASDTSQDFTVYYGTRDQVLAGRFLLTTDNSLCIVSPGAGADTIILCDSADVWSAIGTGGITNGTYYTPDLIGNESSTPTGGDDGDWVLDTTNSVLYVKVNGVWEAILTSGSGADSATVIATDHGYIDCDLLNIKNYSDTNTVIDRIGSSGGITPITDGTGKLGSSLLRLDSVCSNVGLFDTIDGGASNTILFRDTLKFSGTSYVGGFDASGRPLINSSQLNNWGDMYFKTGFSRIYLNNCTMYGSDGSGQGSFIGTPTDPIKTVSTDTLRVGIYSRWDTDYNNTGSPRVTISPFTGISCAAIGIDVSSGDISVTSGKFDAGSVEIDGSKIYLPSDSAFQKISDSNVRYSLLTMSQKNSLDNSCAPSGGNPLLTWYDIQYRMPNFIHLSRDSIGSASRQMRQKSWYNYRRQGPFFDELCNEYPIAENDFIWVPGPWVDTTLVQIGDTVQIHPPEIGLYDMSGMMFTYHPLSDGDSSSGDGYPRAVNPDPPMAHNRFVVTQKGSDELGLINGGYFRTIQAAIDSIPHIEILAQSWSGGVSSDHDTIYFAPISGEKSYPILYIGSVPIDTYKTIPQRYKSQGVWMGRKFAANGIKWQTVSGWSDDSTAVFSDTILTGLTSDTATMIIALPWTIQIEPCTEDVFWKEDSILIHPYGPITIKGSGEKETLISNFVSDEDVFSHEDGEGFGGRSNLIFYSDTSSNGRKLMAGMPITIKDMTIVSAGGKTPGTTEAIQLSGNLRIENTTILYQCIDAFAVIEYCPYEALGGTNSIVFQNSTFISDSNKYIININGGKSSFQSRSCVYSISGTAGGILYTNANLLRSPQFIMDEFYAAYGGSSAFKSTSASDSVMMTFCRSVGFDAENSVSGFLGCYEGVVNFYNQYITDPPIKVLESQMMLQNVVGPK